MCDVSSQLEQVMETETYKNAKLILERFDPDSKKKLTVSNICNPEINIDIR